MRVAVIGAGSWGTAISQHLARKGYEVVIWAYEATQVEAINSSHQNLSYLKGKKLLPSISATASYEEALSGADAACVVSPSAFVRSVARGMAPWVGPELPVICCSKGVEDHTGDLLSEVLDEELSHPERIAVLSGPNHAEEVIDEVPAATVIASDDEGTALFFQELFASDAFRTYVSGDLRGIQLCGAFKNVIAIAVGISYGLGYGDNTAAMLITRGLAEMSRLVVACGGEAITCMGLAGAGDMVVTCMSKHSRNRTFGEALVAGTTVADYQRKTQMVVEGASACRTLQILAERNGVELPLTSMVRAVVWEGMDPHNVASVLLGRPLTTEFYGL